MTAHEPINYLDSVLNEEETRCEYSHQWRNFTISRSGRFKSKNKKRAEVADGKLFDDSTHTHKAKEDEKMKSYKEQQDKNSTRSFQHHSSTSSNSSSFKQQPSTATITTTSSSSASANTRGSRSERTIGTYKSYYETNL